MLRVEIVGMGKTAHLFTKIRENLKKRPNQMTNELAQALHKRVAANLRGPQNQGAGHNTPRLIHDLKLEIGAKGHIVKMAPNPSNYPELATMVEYGTAPHAQLIALGAKSNNRIGYHPGASPNPFWANAIQTFKSTDWDNIVAKYSDMTR